MCLVETINPDQMKYLLQNYQRIADLIPTLQAELKAFYESNIDEDELLESAMIGNRPVYRPGNDGGTFTPDPGSKMTGVVQNRKVITGVKAQVCREIMNDIYTIAYLPRKLENTLTCLHGDERLIVDSLIAGQSSARISDQLRMTTAAYTKKETKVLEKVAAVMHIARPDYRRIVELLSPEK